MTNRLTDARVRELSAIVERHNWRVAGETYEGVCDALLDLIDARELIARRAADAQPAPKVDAVPLRDSRDIETATGRACPSCGFAHVTEGASKSHDWYCNHCQSYGNWDGSEGWTPVATADVEVRAEIVEFVRSYRTKRIGPTMREVLAASRLTGMNTVVAHVNALLELGVLDCHRHENGTMVARSLEVYGE